MKKFLTMGVLALAVAVLSQQQAPAWVNLNAGVGANLGFQSGGNCLLWGAYRNGQPPGFDSGDVCPPLPFPRFPRGGCGDTAAPAPQSHPILTPHATPAPAIAPASRVTYPAYQPTAPRAPVYNPYYGYRR